MDIPTYIILFSFVVSILLVICLKLFKVSKSESRTILLFSVCAIWLLVTIFGELVYTWAGNASCLKYLGCVSGFGGYDAFEHFYFGVVLAVGIIWLCGRFPKYCVLHEELWKNVLLVLALVALVGVLWEFVECAHDAVRLNILHEPLRNIRLHIDLFDQPTNLDTMGDLFFGFVGSIIGIFISL